MQRIFSLEKQETPQTLICWATPMSSFFWTFTSVLVPMKRLVVIAHKVTMLVQSSRQSQKHCPAHRQSTGRAQVDQIAYQSTCNRFRGRRGCRRTRGGTSPGPPWRHCERGPADWSEVCAIPVGEQFACQWDIWLCATEHDDYYTHPLDLCEF